MRGAPAALLRAPGRETMKRAPAVGRRLRVSLRALNTSLRPSTWNTNWPFRGHRATMRVQEEGAPGGPVQRESIRVGRVIRIPRQAPRADGSHDRRRAPPTGLNAWHLHGPVFREAPPFEAGLRFVLEWSPASSDS